jgi:hypothetical protein
MAAISRAVTQAPGIAASGVDGTGRIQHLHAFRGFAIANIVLLHVFDLVLDFNMTHAGMSPAEEWIYIFNEVMFHDSTIYFALISGLLFSVVLRRRGWTRFFRSKLTNVIAPFAVMSLLFTLVDRSYYGASADGAPGMDFLGKYLSNLWHGTAQLSYSDIPVSGVLFAATPLLDTRVTGRHAGMGILVMASLPLFLSRTGREVSLGTVVYFAGVYSVGIFLGEGYAGNLAFLRRRQWALGAVAAASTAALVLLFTRDIDMIGPVSIRESLFYVQKLAFCGLILFYMQRWEKQLPGALDRLAVYSFAIYFMHQFAARIIIHFSKTAFVPPLGGWMIVVLSIALCGLVLISTCLVSRTVQGLCGRHSKWLIGA